MTENPTRVLICDDDFAMRDVLRVLLEDLNCEVVASCKNGKDGVDQFATTRPDLVLMDIKMPGKNGVEAMREILKIDSNAKVIMLSALDDVVVAESSAHSGASGYVRKAEAATVLYGELSTMLDQLGFDSGQGPAA